MKLTASAVAGLVLAAAAGSAAAQVEAYVWKEFGSGGGVTAYYNPVTVTRADGTVTATLKQAFSPAQAMGASAPVGSAINRMTIDCAASTYTEQSRTWYDAAGNALATPAPPAGAQPITAYTNIMQAAQQVLCTG